MFINCPNCRALVATDLATDLPPERCPRCGFAPLVREVTLDLPQLPPAQDAPPGLLADLLTAPPPGSGPEHAQEPDPAPLPDPEPVPAPEAAPAPAPPPAPPAPPESAPAHAAGSAPDPSSAPSPGTEPVAPAAASPEAALPGSTQEPAPEIIPQADPEVAPETIPEADPGAIPEVDPEAIPGATPDATANVDPKATPEADPGVIPEAPPESIPNTDPKTTPQAEPEAVAVPAPLPSAPEADPAPAPTSPPPPPAPEPAPTTADPVVPDPPALHAPRFLRRRGTPGTLPNTRRQAGIAAGLAALLVLQFLLADRARLAASPGWRPVVAALCGALRCNLPAWREPAAIAVEQRDVRPLPGRPGVLRASATIRNDARWDQAWPPLTLTLSDVNGRALGARTFAPAQYLTTPPRDVTMASGESAAIQIDIVEPSPHAVAFHFRFD